MDSPLVSIIITNYNYARYLNNAIDSALNQTYPDVEVIVVDDGSTDNSKAVINSYKEQIIPAFKLNGGQASAFNQGWTISKGDIVCFLDSDDTFTPIKVAEVVKAFQEYQDIGWCFHYLRLVRTSDEMDAISDTLIDEGLKFYIETIDFRDLIKNANLPNFVPATSGLCFSRALLSQIMPMPEAEGVSLSDLYIKYVALSLSKGCVINANLAMLRIHDVNAYSEQNTTNKQQLYAIIDILSAYWMRKKFPKIAKTANKLFARGVGNFLRIGGIEKKYRENIYDYLFNISLAEKFSLLIKTTYYYIKFWLRPS